METPTDIATETPPKSSKFTPETARLAGVMSGISRKSIDSESATKRAKLYAIMALDTLAQYLFDSSPCPHCKRKGPTDIRSFSELTKQLIALVSIVCERLEGRPATISRAHSRATLSEYRKLAAEMRKANLSELSEAAQSLLEADTDEDETIPTPEP